MPEELNHVPPPSPGTTAFSLVWAVVAAAVAGSAAIIAVAIWGRPETQLSIIAAIVGLMTGVTGPLLGFLLLQNNRATKQLHSAVNSRLSQLLSTVGAKENAEGQLTGRAKERAEPSSQAEQLPADRVDRVIPN